MILNTSKNTFDTNLGKCKILEIGNASNAKFNG